MKKINAFFVLAFSLILTINAQAPDPAIMTGVNWVTWADEPDYVAEPYTKATYMLAKATEEWVFDSFDFDFEKVWGKLDVQPVSKAVKGATEVTLDATYGAEFGAFYDDFAIYVVTKFKDDVQQTTDKNLEVMLQSKYAERYEPAFELGIELTKAQANAQYARQLVLGGGKAVIGSGGVSAWEASGATNANWSANTTVTAAGFDTKWLVDDNNTVWSVAQFLFAEHLYYLDDVWAADAASNRVALVPTVGEKISFEVKANAKKGEVEVQHCWNSSENNVYASNYYAGYAEFTDVVVDFEGEVSTRNATGANVIVFVKDNLLKIKGIESADVEIFTALGQRVKSATQVSEIGISELRGGLYIAKIKNVGSYKFVK